MDATVTNCGDCPVMFDVMCCHPGRPEDKGGIHPDVEASYYVDGPPPTWCPLRREPLTVRLVAP